ncbi:CD1375 family protein [Brevibacillus sp. NRS-1366]
MQSIAQIYYELIKDGLKSIDQVPQKIRTDVQVLLDADATAN